MNYKFLQKPEFLFLLLIFFFCIFYFVVPTNEFWNFFIVPYNSNLDFSDLRCLQKFNDISLIFENSQNIYNIQDRCLNYNYPRLWIVVSNFFGLKKDLNLYIFIAFQIFIYIGIFFYLIKKFNSYFFLYLFFSGSSLLLLERANIDLVIFIISFFVFNIRYNILVIFLYFLVILLKLFPFFGIIGIFNKLKDLKMSFFLFISSIFYFCLTYKDILNISQNTPKTGDMSYGILAIKINILKKLSLDINYFFLLSLITLFLILFYLFFFRYFFRNIKINFKSSFLFGSLIYIATFIINTHFDYRLVFIFFIIPSVLQFRNIYLKYIILILSFLCLELNRLITFFGTVGGFINNISKLMLFIFLICIILDLVINYYLRIKKRCLQISKNKYSIINLF
jgi:hypothetical protein